MVAKDSYSYSLIGIVGAVALVALFITFKVYGPAGSLGFGNMFGQATANPDVVIYNGVAYPVLLAEEGETFYESPEVFITLLEIFPNRVTIKTTISGQEGRVRGLKRGDTVSAGGKTISLYVLEPRYAGFVVAPRADSCGGEPEGHNGQTRVCRGKSACCDGVCKQLPNCNNKPDGEIATCGPRQLYCCDEKRSFVPCGPQTSDSYCEIDDDRYSCDDEYVENNGNLGFNVKGPNLAFTDVSVTCQDGSPGKIIPDGPFGRPIYPVYAVCDDVPNQGFYRANFELESQRQYQTYYTTDGCPITACLPIPQMCEEDTTQFRCAIGYTVRVTGYDENGCPSGRSCVPVIPTAPCPLNDVMETMEDAVEDAVDGDVAFPYCNNVVLRGKMGASVGGQEYPRVELADPEVRGISVVLNGFTEPVCGAIDENWCRENNGPGAGDGPFEFEWGDGSVTCSWFPGTHNYETSGRYDIKVHVKNTCGLISERTATVRVGPLPPLQNFKIAVADEAPTSDVILAINIIARLQDENTIPIPTDPPLPIPTETVPSYVGSPPGSGIDVENIVEDVVTPIPVGLAVLFSSIDAREIGPEEVVLAIYFGRAVIIFGDYSDDTLLAQLERILYSMDVPYEKVHIRDITSSDLRDLFSRGERCRKDSDCPQIHCFRAPCPTNVCIGGQCVLSDQPNCHVDNEAFSCSNPFAESRLSGLTTFREDDGAVGFVLKGPVNSVEDATLTCMDGTQRDLVPGSFSGSEFSQQILAARCMDVEGKSSYVADFQFGYTLTLRPTGYNDGCPIYECVPANPEICPSAPAIFPVCGPGEVARPVYSSNGCSMSNVCVSGSILECPVTDIFCGSAQIEGRLTTPVYGSTGGGGATA